MITMIVGLILGLNRGPNLVTSFWYWVLVVTISVCVGGAFARFTRWTFGPASDADAQAFRDQQEAEAQKQLADARREGTFEQMWRETPKRPPG